VIRSVEQFVTTVRTDSAGWPVEQPRWFRGEPAGTRTPLVPSLYRNSSGSSRENQLLQTFRARASAFSSDALPDRKKTDQWLFLAQHVGLPTRLLDWPEGALIAVFFALRESDPVVWMLNPLHLNYHAGGAPPTIDPNSLREFPLPWFNPRAVGVVNIANQNMRGAWEQDRVGVDLPVAVHPTYVHGRLRAQHACFRVHGRRKDSLQSLVSDSILKRYVIDPECRVAIRRELAVLGVTESVAYPDLDGLARDLRDRFLT
jgi:hypothetical protein